MSFKCVCASSSHDSQHPQMCAMHADHKGGCDCAVYGLFMACLRLSCVVMCVSSTSHQDFGYPPQRCCSPLGARLPAKTMRDGLGRLGTARPAPHGTPMEHGRATWSVSVTPVRLERASTQRAHNCICPPLQQRRLAANDAAWVQESQGPPALTATPLCSAPCHTCVNRVHIETATKA